MSRYYHLLFLLALLSAGSILGAQIAGAVSLHAQTATGSTTAGSGLTLADVIGTTLARSVSIRQSVERERMRRSELQIARGAFDLTIGFTASVGRNSTFFNRAEQEFYGVAASLAGTSGYRLGAVKRFRSGVTVSPSVELTRHDALTLRAPTIVQTQAGINVSYPILRAGRPTPEANLVNAAALRLEASELDVRNTRALSVLQAADAYWMYLNAYESLQILEASEEKAGRLLRETRALVAGGERPASDLDQLRADLADRFAARLGADHQLYASRQHLGLQMGLTAQQASALPQPITEFPTAAETSTAAEEIDLFANAQRGRYDLAEAHKTVDAAKRMLDARRIETRPSLNLQLNIGYAARTERELSIEHHLPPLGQYDMGRPNTSVALVLEWPTKNNRARGELGRGEAAWRQSRIAEGDLKRQIASRMRVALKDLHTSADQLAKTDEAVHLYATAVENEEKRLLLGMSTQFDLLLVEERLRNTLLSRVAAEMHYARSIALLRYETGTLPGAEPTTQVEHVINALITPPASGD
jgi:outer membrane protein TolC